MEILNKLESKDFDQELSIAARKEFRKGNVFIAWAMEQKANSLVEGATFEQWFAFNTKNPLITK